MGESFSPDRVRTGSQDSGILMEAAERPEKEQKREGGLAPKKEHVGNKVPLFI